MSYMVDGYYGDTAATAPASERAAFIKRTYLHVAAAMGVFVALEAVLLASGIGVQIVRDVLFANRMAWLALMVVFIGGTYAAQYMARARASVGTQYAGLALYVLLYTILFLPILVYAVNILNAPQLPIQAGLVTLMVFGGLTIGVFMSGKDFSFLGPILWVCSFLALGLIVAAILFGFNLGLVFSGAMVALFAAYIIYDTSNIIHRYQTNEHVAASMALFGSAAMLFYYILRIFLISRDE
jgi:FtsH-binding integral membrane protein